MTEAEAFGEKSLVNRLIHNVVLVPVVVFLLLLSATTFVWLEIKRYHLAEQISDTHEYLEFVSAHLAAHLDVRLVLGQLIREEWLDYRTNDPEDFAAIVKPKLGRFKDIQAINWVDRDGVIRWVNPVAGNERALGLDIRKLPAPYEALINAADTGESQATAPIELAQGGRGFVVYVPIHDAGRLEGFINMVFRIENLIDIALPIDQPKNFDLHITDGDSVVYENHTSRHLAEAQRRMLRIANREWSVAIAPTVHAHDSFFVHNNKLILLCGLIFSIALPSMLFQMMRRNAEFRATQRRLTDFADVSSDWFFETDEKLRFSYFSPRFEEVTGVSPDTLIGKTREEAGAPEADPDQFQAVLSSMAHRLPFRDFEHTRTRTNGTKAYISISARPAYDENGKFTGYRGVGRDITAQKRNQKVLNDALLASEQANRAKSEFLATMSHEFRTPLNAIIGFSEMLKEQYFGKLGADNYVEYAADIHSSGRHMLDLVNDVLDLSTIEAAKRQLTMEDFAFAEIVRDGVRNVETQLAHNGVTVKQDLPEDLPDLHADKRSIFQIVLNLLSNAMKFTGTGGHITISAAIRNGGFEFTVADTGIGIAADKLASITEPFMQTHENPHIAGTGTGLGLTIVKALVDAHGGTLRIESTPGEGTRVTVHLPQPTG